MKGRKKVCKQIFSQEDIGWSNHKVYLFLRESVCRYLVIWPPDLLLAQNIQNTSDKTINWTLSLKQLIKPFLKYFQLLDSKFPIDGMQNYVFNPRPLSHNGWKLIQSLILKQVILLSEKKIKRLIFHIYLQNVQNVFEFCRQICSRFVLMFPRFDQFHNFSASFILCQILAIHSIVVFGINIDVVFLWILQ